MQGIAFRKPADREAAHHEPEEKAPGVAHEDRRRIEVVEEESQQDSGKDRRCDGHAIDPAEHEEDEAKDRGDQRYACRQAVHVVEKVEGIGDADDPEECDYDVEAGDTGPLEDEAELDERQGHQDLADQLYVGFELPEVVVEADHEHARGAAEQGDDLPLRS